MKYILLAGLAALLPWLVTPTFATEPRAAEPWRLQNALNLPDGLHLSGSHRTRFETLDNQFRRGRPGGDQMLALRTQVLAEFDRQQTQVVIELMDSRASLADGGSPINTTMVNTVDVLQAYLGWQTPRSRLRAGRFTLDSGSRRFVARNNYRNTVNAFTGIDWQWQGADGQTLQAFYTLPVNRKPDQVEALLDNEQEFDEQSTDVQFWGMTVGLAPRRNVHRSEFFLFGLTEQDSSDQSTRNRELYTPGLRLYRAKAAGTFDYSVETAVQFGKSRRSSASTDRTNLDHLAHFHHVELGYSWDNPRALRVAIELDYASGDEDPADTDNQRFDTLYGARRFDFGPTGIYGPFRRENLFSPGVRLNLKPSARTSLMMSYRGYWLANDSDSWTCAGAQDPDGRSGSFIGQQIEARLRWDMLPGNVRLETGLARLFAGKFMRRAPPGSDQGDAAYGYTQITVNF